MPIRRVALAVGLFLILLGVLSAGIHFFTQNNNLGTDFFIFWQSGRAVFLDHTSPYSDELSIQNQLTILKRLARPGEDHLTFAYPPFSLLLIYPFTSMPFDWAQALWISMLILLLVTAFALAFPNSPPWVGISFLAFFPVFFGLILGNFAILLTAVLILLLGQYALRDQPSNTWQWLAGFLSAWLAVKLQFTWPFLLLLGLYGLRKRQWRYLAATFTSLLLLGVLSFMLVPNWPIEWLANITQYAAYNQAWPITTYLLKQFIPLDLAVWLSTGLGVLCLGITGWFIYRWWRSSLNIVILFAWSGYAGYLFHPRGASYEQITFLMPLALWACMNVKAHTFRVKAWWFASLIVSWAAFLISNMSGYSAASEFPLLLHTLWIAWILKKEFPILGRKISPLTG